VSAAEWPEARKRDPEVPVPDGGIETGVTASVIAIVASFSVIDPGTFAPQARQNRLLTGTSVEHAEQRIIFWSL
jgi:hypothetical protein